MTKNVLSDDSEAPSPAYKIPSHTVPKAVAKLSKNEILLQQQRYRELSNDPKNTLPSPSLSRRPLGSDKVKASGPIRPPLVEDNDFEEDINAKQDRCDAIELQIEQDLNERQAQVQQRFSADQAALESSMALDIHPRDQNNRTRNLLKIQLTRNVATWEQQAKNVIEAYDRHVQLLRREFPDSVPTPCLELYNTQAPRFRHFNIIIPEFDIPNLGLNPMFDDAAKSFVDVLNQERTALLESMSQHVDMTQDLIDKNVKLFVTVLRPSRFAHFQLDWTKEEASRLQMLRDALARSLHPPPPRVTVPIQQPAFIPASAADVNLDASRQAIFAGQNFTSSNQIHAAELVRALTDDKINNLIKVISSFISAIILITLPPQRGYTLSSWVSLLQDSFHIRSTPSVIRRFQHFINLNSKDFLNLITFNFISPSNSEGYDLSTTTGVSSVTSMIDTACELVHFYTAFYHAEDSPSPFSPIIDSFLSPLRNLASVSVFSVIVNLIHRQLKFLHSAVAITVPVSDYVNSWSIAHAFTSPQSIQKIENFIDSSTQFLLTSNYQHSMPALGSGTMPNAQPSKPHSFGNGKPQNSPTTSTIVDYGHCKGWCVSVFLNKNKTCPRNSVGRQCSMKDSTTGVYTQLKHHNEFQALPVAEKQRLRSHFADHVKNQLSAKQVLYYSK